MATVTSIGSGNWNADAATVWSTGAVPADGDKFVIAAGHTITLDADYSGITNGFAASEIAGTLQVSTSAGTYGLKLNGILSATAAGAKFNIGTDENTPLPANVQFNLVMTVNAYISGGSYDGFMNWYCKVPDRPYTTVKTLATSGDTTIYVDHNLGTDAEWAVNRYIRISDSSGTLPDSEERQIASVGSDGGGYYVVVSAGLTGNKSVGSTVVLCHRNIQVTSVNTSGAYGMRGIYGGFISGSIRNARNAFYANRRSNFKSFVVSGGEAGSANYAGGVIFTNCIFAGITGGTQNSGDDVFINCLFTGISNAINVCPAQYYYNCLFSCNNTVAAKATCYLYNCTSQNNTYHFTYPNLVYAKNCTFTGGTLSTYHSYQRRCYIESINHGNVTGELYIQTPGGYIQNSTTQKPQGYSWSFAHSVASSAFPCFWQEQIRLAPNEKCAYAVNLYKTTTGWSTLPKAELLDFYKDPLIDSSQTALKTVTMTDSSGTWERFLLEYTNTTSYTLDLLMRVSAQNVSGTCYSRSDRILTQQPNGVWSPTWR